MGLTKRVCAGLAVLGVAWNANATLVSGSSLQGGLDALTVVSATNPTGTFLDVNDDQHAADETWLLTASGASVNRLLFEFASFEVNTSFGIYDPSNPARRVELFDGSACGTADTSCAPLGNLAILYGSGATTFTNLLTSQSETFASSVFGYYIDVGATGNTFYSQSSLNTDVADAAHGGTTDHMVAYAGDGSLMLDIDGAGPGGAAILAPGEYILAWEDQLFPSSDYDYSDMVVLVESVTPIAEPGVLALLSIGLIGIGALQRRPRH